MRFCGNKVIFIVLLLGGSSKSQDTGQSCTRRDRTRGVCLEMNECFDQQGHIESASKLELCSSSTFNKVITCCRNSPNIIAREKCEEWKKEAAAMGSSCTFSVPLARGGVHAIIGEYPHMVSLLDNIGGGLIHVCGGSLIAKQYVLTAAHCVDSRKKMYVRIGGHDHRVKESGVTLDAEVIEKILHPGYSHPRRYNDIALLRLGFEVPFSKRIQPACLPFQNRRIEAGTKMVVAGWGVYENAGPTSEVLRKAEVTIIDRLKCDTSPLIVTSTFRYPAGITDSIICADEKKSGSCSGDSGGPLMKAAFSTCDVKEIVGLVSRGVIECKSSEIPGIYIRIEYYLDWIVKTVWPEEQ